MISKQSILFVAVSMLLSFTGVTQLVSLPILYSAEMSKDTCSYYYYYELMHQCEGGDIMRCEEALKQWEWIQENCETQGGLAESEEGQTNEDEEIAETDPNYQESNSDENSDKEQISEVITTPIDIGGDGKISPLEAVREDSAGDGLSDEEDPLSADVGNDETPDELDLTDSGKDDLTDSEQEVAGTDPNNPKDGGAHETPDELNSNDSGIDDLIESEQEIAGTDPNNPKGGGGHEIPDELDSTDSGNDDLTDSEQEGVDTIPNNRESGSDENLGKEEIAEAINPSKEIGGDGKISPPEAAREDSARDEMSDEEDPLSADVGNDETPDELNSNDSGTDDLIESEQEVAGTDPNNPKDGGAHEIPDELDSTDSGTDDLIDSEQEMADTDPNNRDSGSDENLDKEQIVEDINSSKDRDDQISAIDTSPEDSNRDPLRDEEEPSASDVGNDQTPDELNSNDSGTDDLIESEQEIADTDPNNRDSGSDENLDKEQIAEEVNNLKDVGGQGIPDELDSIDSGNDALANSEQEMAGTDPNIRESGSGENLDKEEIGEDMNTQKDIGPDGEISAPEVAREDSAGDGLSDEEDPLSGAVGNDETPDELDSTDSGNDDFTDREQEIAGTDSNNRESGSDENLDKEEFTEDINNPKDVHRDGKVDAVQSSEEDSDGEGTPDQSDHDDENEHVTNDTANGKDEPLPELRDTDDDRVPDVIEKINGTDIYNPDSDGDGELDGDEYGEDFTAPLDEDKDGEIDALESSILDSDGDNTKDQFDSDDKDRCVPDNSECRLSEPPLALLDSDNDGLPNAYEIRHGLNAYNNDTDGDGILDNEEIGENPNRPRDSDEDGQIDALESSWADKDSDDVPDEQDFDNLDPCVPNANLCNSENFPKIEKDGSVNQRDSISAPTSALFDTTACFNRVVVLDESQIAAGKWSFEFRKHDLGNSECPFITDQSCPIVKGSSRELFYAVIPSDQRDIPRRDKNFIPLVIKRQDGDEYLNSQVPFELNNYWEDFICNESYSCQIPDELFDPFKGCKNHGMLMDPDSCGNYSSYINSLDSDCKFMFIVPARDKVYVLGDKGLKELHGWPAELFNNPGGNKKEIARTHYFLYSLALIAGQADEFQILPGLVPTKENMRAMISGKKNGLSFLIGISGEKPAPGVESNPVQIGSATIDVEKHIYLPIRMVNMDFSRELMDEIANQGVESSSVLHEVLNEWYKSGKQKSIRNVLPRHLIPESQDLGSPQEAMRKLKSNLKPNGSIELDGVSLNQLLYLVEDLDSEQFSIFSVQDKEGRSVPYINKNNSSALNDPYVQYLVLSDNELRIWDDMGDGRYAITMNNPNGAYVYQSKCNNQVIIAHPDTYEKEKPDYGRMLNRYEFTEGLKVYSENKEIFRNIHLDGCL